MNDLVYIASFGNIKGVAAVLSLPFCGRVPSSRRQCHCFLSVEQFQQSESFFVLWIMYITCAHWKNVYIYSLYVYTIYTHICMYINMNTNKGNTVYVYIYKFKKKKHAKKRRPRVRHHLFCMYMHSYIYICTSWYYHKLIIWMHHIHLYSYRVQTSYIIIYNIIQNQKHYYADQVLVS